MLLISIHHRLCTMPLLAALALLHPQPFQAQTQLADFSAPVADLPHTETMGNTLLARGRYLAAIDLLRGLEPKTASIYNKLGVAYEHMYMAPEARQAFEQAVRLDPHFAEAFNNLGTVFHTSGDFKHAERFYKKAIHLDSKNATAELNLGTLYYARAKYSKGDLAYRRALLLNPHALEQGAMQSVGAPTDARALAELRYHIAKTYAEAGNNDLALESLHRAISCGFRDKKRLLADPEFASVRTTPAFGSVLAELAGG